MAGIRPIPRSEAIDLGPDERPFTRTGRVNQGYLYPLSATFGRALLEHADPAALEPADGPDGPAPGDNPPVEAGPATIPLEQGLRIEFDQVVTASRRAAVRTEWQLVDTFVAAMGVEPVRRRYPLASGASIYCDLYVASGPVLVEAKASATRGSVREAIGQLHDYAHKEEQPAHKLLLVPQAPAADLLEVLTSLRILVLWPNSPAWSAAAADFDAWVASGVGGVGHR